MKIYKVEMTRTNVARVEFDESFFNEEWFEEFRDFFYDYFTLDELAEYIIFNVIENNQRFIEGIGYPLFDGRKPYVREGQENDINEHVNVIINIYDTNAEFEIEEGSGMIGKKYKTRYKTIVPKGMVGTCVDIEVERLIAYKLKFDNGECFWF